MFYPRQNANASSNFPNRWAISKMPPSPCRVQSATMTALPGLSMTQPTTSSGNAVNRCFMIYRYGPGDFFAPHTDGSWPGSRVIDGELVDNAYHDRWSQLSFLLFLTEDYVGGATQFYVSPDNSLTPARRPDTAAVIDVRTPVGGALCFPHGVHPLHCMHASQEITSGTKYIIRSDILFDL
jgi:hypothetical protein